MQSTRPSSRLSVDPTTQLPSVAGFDALSEFLRGSIVDEECRNLSETMTQLAQHVELICAALRTNRLRAANAPRLMDLLTVLREHRNQVVELSLPWRGLYEYAAYLQSLTNFRVLIGQWLLPGAGMQAELPVTAEDFELIAWRTMGEGTLLVDVYEQWCTAGAARESDTQSALAALEEPQVQRAMSWWRKLRS